MDVAPFLCSPEQRLDRGFLEKWRWSHLIMDEAHALKNRNASRTTRLRRVSNASRRRIMMTGARWRASAWGWGARARVPCCPARLALLRACHAVCTSLTPAPPPLPPSVPPAGTPLQNDLAELQNLLHFLLPSVFAAQGFEDLAEMLQARGRAQADLGRAWRLCWGRTARLTEPAQCCHRRPTGALQGDDEEIAKLTERMKSLLGPFVLRRLKTEVAGQLTEKTHATGGRRGVALPWAALGISLACGVPLLAVQGTCTPTRAPATPLVLSFSEFIEMTEEQAGLYAASVARMRSQITGRAAAAAADRSNKAVEKFLRTLGAKKISHMFTHLRKIAQHPLLVRSNFTDDQVAVVARMAHERWGGGGGGSSLVAAGTLAGNACIHAWLPWPVSLLAATHTHTPSPPRLPCRSLFGGAATEKRVREELLSYSDFSLHAFCYNAGPDFAQFRLNQSHMMASTKFRFLEKLLKQVRRGQQTRHFRAWGALRSTHHLCA